MAPGPFCGVHCRGVRPGPSIICGQLRPFGPSGEITLSGDSITVSGNGAKVSGSTVTITQSGNYTVSGTLSDGQILVDAGKEDDIIPTPLRCLHHLHTSAPIFIKKASSVSIVLADGNDNTVADTDNYVLDEGEDEPDAAIFSQG